MGLDFQKTEILTSPKVEVEEAKQYDIVEDRQQLNTVLTNSEAVQRKQDFGMIKNAFVRIIDARGNRELCKYDLSENYDGMTAMIFGKLYRNNGEWMFDAIGQATKDLSLGELANRFVANRFM